MALGFTSTCPAERTASVVTRSSYAIRAEVHDIQMQEEPDPDGAVLHLLQRPAPPCRLSILSHKMRTSTLAGRLEWPRSRCLGVMSNRMMDGEDEAPEAQRDALAVAEEHAPCRGRSRLRQPWMRTACRRRQGRDLTPTRPGRAISR